MTKLERLMGIEDEVLEAMGINEAFVWTHLRDTCEFIESDYSEESPAEIGLSVGLKRETVEEALRSLNLRGLVSRERDTAISGGFRYRANRLPRKWREA